MAENLDTLVAKAISLLPANGSTMEFNAYKTALYSAMPDQGKEAFTRMLTANLINKSLNRDSSGNTVVLLSRKGGV